MKYKEFKKEIMDKFNGNGTSDIGEHSLPVLEEARTSIIEYDNPNLTMSETLQLMDIGKQISAVIFCIQFEAKQRLLLDRNQ